MINNYYKPGPSTFEELKKRLISPGQDGKPSWFYVDGNYMYGNKSISEDNTLGIEDIKSGTVFSDKPYEVFGHDQLTIKTAQEAYDAVLKKAGAIYPRRDAVDARIVNDVKNGTGRLINNEWEVGGYPEMKSGTAPIDNDHDGMADKWEEVNGLNSRDPNDGKEITASGYTNLEQYINSLVSMESEALNPNIELVSPKLNSIHKEGSTVKMKVKLKDKRDISKVEYYSNDQKIGEAANDQFDFEWEDAPDGTWYISAKAIDEKGNTTQTTSMPVHVNKMKQTGEWTSKDVGKVRIKGNTTQTDEGVTVKGAGRIDQKADAFQFAYQEIKGDAELIARIDSLTRVDNNALSGLMIRESLAKDAATAIISSSIVKADKQATPYSVHFSTRMKKGMQILAPGSYDRPEEIGVPSLNGTTLPYWLKIVRVDHTITGYASKDGEEWIEIGRQYIPMKERVYVGFAVDAAKNSSQTVNYNTASFSNISLKGELGRKTEN